MPDTVLGTGVSAVNLRDKVSCSQGVPFYRGRININHKYVNERISHSGKCCESINRIT